jgi:hypothetical protein
MPLSESEQRILSDLEDSLSNQDPRFARSVRRASVVLSARRRVLLSIVGFIVGLVMLVVFLTHSILLSLTGVVVMLLSSLVVTRHLELKGRASASGRHR